jgi:hypothetical protein
VDSIIFAIIPTVLFAVAGVVLIERLRIKAGEQPYQHEEYRPDQKAGDGNGNGHGGNGHGPPKRRRRTADRPPEETGEDG